MAPIHTVQMSGYQITATEEVLNSLSIYLDEIGLFDDDGFVISRVNDGRDWIHPDAILGLRYVSPEVGYVDGDEEYY